MSSKILWIRYNSTSEVYTYTFQGLEKGKIYTFSGLIGWHNNANDKNKVFTITVNGTKELAKVAETFINNNNARFILHPFSIDFMVPSDDESTNFTLKFTSNQAGDCMEALSAMSIVEKTDAKTSMENASESSPYDMTSWLTTPSFENTLPCGWTYDYNFGGGSDIKYHTANPSDGDRILNIWSGNVNSINVSQNVTLPKGKYRVYADLRVDQAKYITNQGVYASVGGNITKSETISNVSDPWEEKDGWNTVSTEFNVANETVVTIGISSTGDGKSSAGWFQADNVKLHYLGNIDDAEAIATAKDVLSSSLSSAKALASLNIGSNAFQVPETAVSVTTLNSAISDAQEVFDNESATLAEITEATEALNNSIDVYNTDCKEEILNTPAEGTRYYLKPSTSGHAKLGNAVLVTLGSTGNNNPTGYSFGASASPKDYLAQAFIFTQVEGNNYNISIETTEGIVYLTYGSLNGSAAGWKAQQIQGTTNPDNKGTFKIEVSNVKNSIKIFNTENNNYIDCQAGGALYTDTDVKFEDFEVVKAEQAEVAGSLAAGKYATRIFPFIPTLPEGVKAYTFGGVEEGNVITLNAVDSPTANVPYILENTSSNEVDITLSGYGLAKQDVYTVDGLTGSFAESTDVPVGNYVLQTLDNGQKFYRVGDETDTVKMPAYRAYLTIDNPAGVKAFSFGGETTGINGVETLTDGAVESIYTINGTRVNSLQKGLNIVKMSNGKTQKVLVK